LALFLQQCSELSACFWQIELLEKMQVSSQKEKWHAEEEGELLTAAREDQGGEEEQCEGDACRVCRKGVRIRGADTDDEADRYWQEDVTVAPAEGGCRKGHFLLVFIQANLFR
jgi:hypothetical protein